MALISPGQYMVNELHSDVLKEKYGQIHFSVEKQKDCFRVSSFTNNAGKIITYSVVRFAASSFSLELEAVHGVIMAGAPIGQAFRLKSYDLVKKYISDFIIDTPKVFAENSLLTTGRLAEIYFRVIGKDEEYYAEVCEIYCPSFRLPTNINSFHNEAVTQRIKLLLAHAELTSYSITLITL